MVVKSVLSNYFLLAFFLYSPLSIVINPIIVSDSNQLSKSILRLSNFITSLVNVLILKSVYNQLLYPICESIFISHPYYY